MIRSHQGGEPGSEAARASEALVENLRDVGVDFVRCWFPWRFFEQKPVPETDLSALLEKGYRTWPMDTMVNLLSDARIGLVPVLACGYEMMLPDGLNPSGDPSLYLRRVAVHPRLLVRHYKNSVKFWQIENEPNWWPMHEAAAWGSGAIWLEREGFRDELLELLNTVVHEEDSQARTIINLEADTGKLEPGEYARHCDILGLDFYPNYKQADPIDAAILRRAEEFQEAIDKPVFIAETGYPSGPGLLGYTQEKQAQYV